MDIGSSNKSLFIIYYLSIFYLIKATLIREVPQKNIRHSRSRPYFLIDNRHISEPITPSPITPKENLLTRPYSASQQTSYSNQTESEDTFLYFYEADELARVNKNSEVIDVETGGKATPTIAAYVYEDTEISKSLVGADHTQTVLKNKDDKKQNISAEQKNTTKNEEVEDKINLNALKEEKIDKSDEESKKLDQSYRSGNVDIVTRFLRIVESQHLLGENCTAGTDLNLGEGVVDRYAQERFRIEADVAVNRANMLTRLWKYSDHGVVMSEYFLHASVFSMVEFDDDIFAAGNCYDQYQYKDYWLFCPYAYRLPEGQILVKDLAVEYKYLSNTSEWFYIARKNAENVIKNYNQFSRGKLG